MVKRKHYLYLGYYMNLKMFYDKRKLKKAVRPCQLRSNTGTEKSGASLPRQVTSPALLASYHIYSGNEPVTASYQKKQGRKKIIQDSQKPV